MKRQLQREEEFLVPARRLVAFVLFLDSLQLRIFDKVSRHFTGRFPVVRRKNNFGEARSLQHGHHIDPKTDAEFFYVVVVGDKEGEDAGKRDDSSEDHVYPEKGAGKDGVLLAKVGILVANLESHRHRRACVRIWKRMCTENHLKSLTLFTLDPDELGISGSL